MEFEISMIKKQMMKTSNWSGGTTTQMLIYPQDADYANRDFLWRISTARVEVEESTFTSLPGINRILMILDGKLMIEHEGYYSKLLNAYDTDIFLGDWVTKSSGKVVDFNLMMKEGIDGLLDTIAITANSSADYILNRGLTHTSTSDGKSNERDQSDSNANVNKNVASFIYSPFSDIEIKTNKEKYQLSSGDMLFIDNIKGDNLIEFINLNGNDIKIIIGKIQY